MRFAILIGFVVLGVAIAEDPVPSIAGGYVLVTDFDAFREVINTGLALIEEKDQIKFEIEEILSAKYQVVRGIRYLAELKLKSYDEIRECHFETLVGGGENYQRVTLSCEPDFKVYSVETGTY